MIADVLLLSVLKLLCTVELYLKRDTWINTKYEASQSSATSPKHYVLIQRNCFVNYASKETDFVADYVLFLTNHK